MLQAKLERRQFLNGPDVGRARVRMSPPSRSISLTFQEVAELIRILDYTDRVMGTEFR